MADEIAELLAGYQQFYKTYFIERRSVYQNLVAKGQHPKALLLSCADSRVDPAILFNCDPGDLFTVRNVANLVPPCEETASYHGTSAALEFGICYLKLKHIILLGHSQCGGIQALLDQSVQQQTAYIAHWVGIANTAREEIVNRYTHLPVEQQQQKASQLALQQSLHNLLTFPWINQAVMEKKLTLHAWFFEMSKGELLAFDEATDDFQVISNSSY